MLLKRLENPRVAEVILILDGPPSEDLLQGLIDHPHLVDITLDGHINDGTLARLLAKPTLRALTVTSWNLSPRAFALAQQATHVETVELYSAQFPPDLIEAHPLSWNQKPQVYLPSVTPDAPPRKERFLGLGSTLAAKRDAAVPGRVGPPTAALSASGPAAMPEIGVACLKRDYPGINRVNIALSEQATPWHWLKEFPEVRHVRFYRAEMTRPLGEWIVNLPQLNQLETLQVMNSRFSRPADDLAWLKKTPHLRWLALAEDTVTVAALVNLAACPNLRDLHLHKVIGQSGSKPSNMAFLRNGSRWERLVAPDLRITPQDLKELARNHDINTLAVDGLLIDETSVALIEEILSRGAIVALDRADLSHTTVARLQRYAQNHGGQFDVTTYGHSFGVNDPPPGGF